MMLTRNITPKLIGLIDTTPAVGLLGPRQVGKTTVALEVAKTRPSIYLDLESDADRARLSEPERYLAGHADKLVILDEVHRTPNIFQVLRRLIDKGGRAGKRTGRFLLLGSASIDLLRQPGEALAGHIAYLEMGPLDLREVGAERREQLWLRGGFAGSFLAGSDADSLRWRNDFIRTCLWRDAPQFGARVAPETLRRLWTMLAHRQCAVLNAAELARGLGIAGSTVGRYLDLMVDLLLVRRLPAWHVNIGKRFTKSPKAYVRDSGLLHALLRLPDREALLNHPAAGGSWEGLVTETLIMAAPDGTTPSYYQIRADPGIDLLLSLPNGRLWAIKASHNLSARISNRFHNACEDLRPERAFVVYPETERFALAHGAEAISLEALVRELAAV